MTLGLFNKSLGYYKLFDKGVIFFYIKKIYFMYLNKPKSTDDIR